MHIFKSYIIYLDSIIRVVSIELKSNQSMDSKIENKPDNEDGILNVKRHIVKCQHCNQEIQTKSISQHFEVCPGYPISCPNECGAEFIRRELSEHKSECDLEVVTCPYKEYGCKAESMFRMDLLAHQEENIVEHQDKGLVQMSRSQSEIRQLKNEIARLKKGRNVMNDLKCKGMSIKQLDGVEWEIKNLVKLQEGEEREGPIFYVNRYKLRIYVFIILRGITNNLCFYLRRIEGEFDRNLGLAFITHYRVVNVNRRNFNASRYQEGVMNYQLMIRTESEEIELYDYVLYNYSPHNPLRFYFDINSTF